MGKRRLDLALSSVPQEEYSFDIEWKPFMEHPHIKEGDLCGAAEFYREKYKKTSIWHKLREFLHDQGKQHAINFNFEAPVCCTLPAHRLVTWAHRFNKQHELMEALFVAFHEDGLDISDKKVLTRLALAVGLPSPEGFLDTDELLQTVIDSHQEARKMRLVDIPNFTLFYDQNRKQERLEGAQSHLAFVEKFKQIRKSVTQINAIRRRKQRIVARL